MATMAPMIEDAIRIIDYTWMIKKAPAIALGTAD
jgi:hypothetical protein